MQKINYGGPAFPCRMENNGDEPFFASGVEIEPGYFVQFPGMTLRDYFAAKAMQGMFAADTDTSVKPIERKAAEAYLMADAMLAAREKKEGDA